MTGTRWTGESASMRALRVVALLESLSFAVLIVGSVLRRTTGPDIVPVLGPIHGALFVLLVVLVLGELKTLRWSPRFTALMLTIGSPFAHFAVRATKTGGDAREESAPGASTGQAGPSGPAASPVKEPA